ncbi:monovalent cation:proton antiporter-2 (CPA2) family protein [Pseudokordiimonas caeni]|uniref:monovalent cation:proton antiporter-2 (CPA2) family protein n=1 Tax=Pseudokordiimonas caeni TaxID=2997908 RepID=UPI002811EB0E|nr:monovalent cation:proton antiporter-2 (CPA2) family protein [Pseudokordiimonas caeni]
MEHHSTGVFELVAILGAAVACGALMMRLGLGTVIGYLLAGFLIGPSVLKVIPDPARVAGVAEFGVIFLLFIIGIEMKPRRLYVMRRMVFGVGGAQFLITTIVLAWGLHAFFGLSVPISVVAGSGLALSSTAFGLQIMTERGELNSQRGRTAFAVLLLQDLAVVPLLALLPMLEGKTSGTFTSFLLAFAQTVAILGVTLLSGRYLLGPILRMVANRRSAEMFSATAILIVVGYAWLMEIAGLSMAMGAFLAGIMLAESEFRHQVEGDIQPYRGLLLGLFFMTVGMGLDLQHLLDNALLVFGAAVALMLVKAVIMTGVGRFAAGLDWPDAARAATLLSGAGEFGFVLFAVAVSQAVLAGDMQATLNSVIVITLVITPFVVPLVDRLMKRFDRELPTPVMTEEECPATPPVLIAGFGRVGRTVARLLDRHSVPWIAIDGNQANVSAARAEGANVFLGDARRREVLVSVGAGKAAALVITLDSPETAEATLMNARMCNPGLPVHIRAHSLTAASHLLDLGAARAVPEAFEGSLQLGVGVALSLGIPEAEAQASAADLRALGYADLNAHCQTDLSGTAPPKSEAPA